MRKLYPSLLFLTFLFSLLASTSCSMMHEDRSKCPECTPLRVVLKYDYNTLRADLFADHVQQATVYVADAATGRIVAKLTAENKDGEWPLRNPDFAFNFYDLPEDDYRVMAVANSPIATPPAELNPAPADLDEGSNLSDMSFAITERWDGIPFQMSTNQLDTVWYALSDRTLHVAPGSAPADTLSLMRLTNNLNITLIQSENPADNDASRYTVKVVDNNFALDDQCLPLPATVVYKPYAAWTVETRDEEDATTDPSRAAGDIVDEANLYSRAAGDVVARTAHYDLSLNRLIAHAASGDNARLQIINNEDNRTIVDIDLIHYLAMARTAAERAYPTQEFLDREYDYRLAFFLVGNQWRYMTLSINVLAWSLRIQNEGL